MRIFVTRACPSGWIVRKYLRIQRVITHKIDIILLSTIKVFLDYYPPEVGEGSIGRWEFSCCNTSLLSVNENTSEEVLIYTPYEGLNLVN